MSFTVTQPSRSQSALAVCCPLKNARLHEASRMIRITGRPCALRNHSTSQTLRVLPTTVKSSARSKKCSSARFIAWKIVAASSQCSAIRYSPSNNNSNSWWVRWSTWWWHHQRACRCQWLLRTTSSHEVGSKYCAWCVIVICCSRVMNS